MLEHVPHWLGAMMRNVRAGHSKLTIVQPGIVTSETIIDLSSPAFANGGRLPERFTADGEGVSPPLIWGNVPAEAESLALIVEDPDAPAVNPLVHAVVWNIPADERRLAEGAIGADGPGEPDGRDVGRSSLGEGWLPPDPPSGHGPHDYVFQLFALAGVPEIESNPGRSALVEAIRGHVVAAGLLVGSYSRGEAEDAGVAGSRAAIA
jgi:Raf kinase inhibitor-like YbhB/YbcL family protein